MFRRMAFVVVTFSVLCLVILGIPLSSAQAEKFEFHQLNVLGTELHLYLDAESQIEAEAIERWTLDEIDRLARRLSSYDAESELSRWNRSGEWTHLSPELTAVLELAQSWHERSQGAFQPGVELATRVWQRAEERQQLPEPAELAKVAGQLQELGWRWNADRSAAQANPALPISLNAIAKGWIIDQLVDRLERWPHLKGGAVAIGGDLRCFGKLQRTIGVRAPADNLLGPFVDSFALRSAAVATSSGAFRGFTIGSVRYSHLIDPRSAAPVRDNRSVTIVAERAADADALATSCSVLPIEEAMALVESTPKAACLIVESDGKIHRSTRWPASVTPLSTQLVAASADWNGGMEMEVKFQIHQARQGGRYRRPYVAVWVEDKDGYPVRTLVLWVQASGPGPRWIPDLKRWYKSDQLRKLVDDVDLVDTITEATRKPGSYSVVWNGEDDHQKLVEPGEYTLYVEAAREHGTYQLMKKKLKLRDQPLDESLDDNAEIKSASIHYRKKSS